MPSAALLEQVGEIVDGVLDRVADAVQRGPFPPLDYWDAKARKSSEKEAAKERRKRRKRDGRAPMAEGVGEDEGLGWETVLVAVREREDVSTRSSFPVLSIYYDVLTALSWHQCRGLAPETSRGNLRTCST